MMTLRPISPLVVFLQQGWSHFSYYQQNNCTKFTWKGHHCECQIQHLKSKVSFHIKHWSRFGLLWANFNFWRKNMQKYFWRKISYIPLYFLFQYVWKNKTQICVNTYIMSIQPWVCNWWASKYNQSSIYVKYHIKRSRVFEIHMRPKKDSKCILYLLARSIAIPISFFQ